VAVSPGRKFACVKIGLGVKTTSSVAARAGKAKANIANASMRPSNIFLFKIAFIL